MTDPRELQHLLEERSRRQLTQAKPLNLSTNLFPEQAAFVNDPAKRKAALCSRRSGKSYGCAIYLIQSALTYRGERFVYITYTRQKARELMEKPIAALLREHSIHFTFHRSELRFTLENGSEIILRGANKPEEIDKLRGDHFPLVIIDECGHGAFNKYLDPMINEVIEGCVAQHDGTIVMLGTPSNFVHNLFFAVTTNTEPGWSVHSWTFNSNPHIRDEVNKTIQRKLKFNPLWSSSDAFKREWLGQWAIESTQLCYHIQDRNLIAAPPSLTNARYLLGCDLGWNDATAFTIGAFTSTDPTLYILESHKSSYLDVTATANFVHDLEKRYKFSQYIIDGSSKQTVEEMKQRHRIPWLATTKSPNYKFEAIKRLNADLQTANIKIVSPTNQDLIKEAKHLVWDETNPTKEKASCPNHILDSFLYLWTNSRHYLSRPTKEEPIDPSEPPTRLRINITSESESLFDYLEYT